jgi:hypothetical protein
MGYTMAQCRTAVREAVRDVGAAVWTDAQLDRAVEEAVGVLAGWFPRQEMQSFTTGILGNDTFILNSNTLGRVLLGIAALELPHGTYIPPEPWEQATQLGRRATRSGQQAYRWRSGSTGAEIRLRSAATVTTMRAFLWASFVFPNATTGTEFDGDAFDFGLLVKLAAREALTYYASEQARTAGANLTYLFNDLLPILDTQITEARNARRLRRDVEAPWEPA